MTQREPDRPPPPEFDRTARLELLYRMVSAISHDFNNVLATASMYSELLLQDPAVEGTTAEDVREILEAARRGAALTAFLGVLKDSRGLSLEPADAGVQLGHLQKIVGRLLPDQVGIEVGAPTGDLMVRIDRVRLQQAIFAVVWAAAESLAETGGVVRVSLEPGAGSVAVEIVAESADEGDGGFGGAQAGGAQAGGAQAGAAQAGLDDSVVTATRDLLEGFGGELEVDDDTAAYRLVLPRAGTTGEENTAAEHDPDVGVVVVNDPGLSRLIEVGGLRAIEVSSPEEAEARADSDAGLDVIVGPASPGMFAVTRRIRAAGHDVRLLLIGTAVDAALPPDLDGDAGVELIRAPASGSHLVELIRASVGGTG